MKTDEYLSWWADAYDRLTAETHPKDLLATQAALARRMRAHLDDDWKARGDRVFASGLDPAEVCVDCDGRVLVRIDGRGYCGPCGVRVQREVAAEAAS